MDLSNFDPGALFRKPKLNREERRAAEKKARKERERKQKSDAAKVRRLTSAARTKGIRANIFDA